MTVTVINGYSTTAQTVGDTLLVGANGILTSPTDEAITVNANYASVFIKGAVIGDGGEAVLSEGFRDVTLAIDEGGLVTGNYAIKITGGSSNSVENHGRINANNWGVALWGDYGRLVNTGTITGEGTSGSYNAVSLSGNYSLLENTGNIVGGVDFYGSHLRMVNAGWIDGQTTLYSGALDVTNHGTMTSWSTTLDISSDGVATGVARVFNDGTISGDTAVNISSGANRHGELVNAGTLDGKVKFGGGDDLYDGRAGKVFGEITMGHGNDTAQGGAGTESIYGNEGADQIFGNGGDDFLSGDEGRDVLRGGDGSDSMGGGTDEDEMHGDAGSDFLAGQGGADTIEGGAGADTLMGGAEDDLIDAGKGNDVVFGGAGADDMQGGLGIDTLDYRDSDAAVKVNLGTGSAAFGFAQGDEFSGFENLSGSGLGDTLTGSSGANVIQGWEGDDVIKGGAGADQLRGGAGADMLEGGAGRDVLFGGDGADAFLFRTLADSIVDPLGRDVIRDFQQGLDHIDLSFLDARAGVAGNQAFAFLATEGAAFTGSGQLRFDQVDGNTLVQGNVNGDLGADFSILLSGTWNLTAGDFVL